MAAVSASSFVSRAKRMRFNDPVRIEVGPENNRETFTIDAEVLSARSLFFRKALSGKFKEAEERMVKLPEDDPELFGTYLHLVNTNELCILPDPLPAFVEEAYETKWALVKLYVLAQKLQDVKSKNGIMRGIIAACERKYPKNGGESFLSPAMVAVLYAGTARGSMGRKIAIEYKAWESSNAEDLLTETWPSEFLSELAFELKTFPDIMLNKKRLNWRRDHPEEYMEKETEE